MPRTVFQKMIYYLHYYYCLMKNQYFKNCHLFEFPKKHICLSFGKSENHILKIGCDDLKCTIALITKKKKKIILDRSNTKLLLIIIIIFCFKKHFFCHLLSQMCTLFWFCALHTYQIFDWYTNRFNEIMLERNKYENMCSKYLLLFFNPLVITLVWYVGVGWIMQPS